MKQQKRFQDFLAERKLKKTPQRTLVWELLVDSDGHPSVEEIRERLLERGHRVGLSTIYRTVKILLDSGMIRQSKIDNTTLYEPLISQPNHIHFVCNQCGKTKEFASPKIERLIKSVTDEHQFEASFSRYAIFGLCRICAKKEARQAGLSDRHRQQKILARDALELTLAVERRGYSFYTSASKKTQNTTGRRMFRQLAAEESEHLDRLQGEYKTLMEENGWLRREASRLPASRKIATEIFPQKKLLQMEVSEETTHLEALSIAIDLEQRSHRFFDNFARQLEDPRARKVFRKFALEERSHLEGLLEEYEKLKADGDRDRKKQS